MDNIPQQPQDLELHYTVSTVSNDGQVTALNSAVNGLCIINFVQMRPLKMGKPQADVVASISFPSLDALKKFLNDTQRTIDQHEKREK